MINVQSSDKVGGRFQFSSRAHVMSLVQGAMGLGTELAGSGAGFRTAPVGG